MRDVDDAGFGRMGPNGLMANVGPITVWFSYATLVAFRVEGSPPVVCQNMWGSTTGKHLNWADRGEKSSRVDRETFRRLWEEQVAKMRVGFA